MEALVDQLRNLLGSGKRTTVPRFATFAGVSRDEATTAMKALSESNESVELLFTVTGVRAGTSTPACLTVSSQDLDKKSQLLDNPSVAVYAIRSVESGNTTNVQDVSPEQQGAANIGALTAMPRGAAQTCPAEDVDDRAYPLASRMASAVSTATAPSRLTSAGASSSAAVSRAASNTTMMSASSSSESLPAAQPVAAAALSGKVTPPRERPAEAASTTPPTAARPIKAEAAEEKVAPSTSAATAPSPTATAATAKPASKSLMDMLRPGGATEKPKRTREAGTKAAGKKIKKEADADQEKEKKAPKERKKKEKPLMTGSLGKLVVRGDAPSQGPRDGLFDDECSSGGEESRASFDEERERAQYEQVEQHVVLEPRDEMIIEDSIPIPMAVPAAPAAAAGPAEAPGTPNAKRSTSPPRTASKKARVEPTNQASMMNFVSKEVHQMRKRFEKTITTQTVQDGDEWVDTDVVVYRDVETGAEHTEEEYKKILKDCMPVSQPVGAPAEPAADVAAAPDTAAPAKKEKASKSKKNAAQAATKPISSFFTKS